jgi:hypothetical protein
MIKIGESFAPREGRKAESGNTADSSDSEKPGATMRRVEWMASWQRHGRVGSRYGCLVSTTWRLTTSVVALF